MRRFELLIEEACFDELIQRAKAKSLTPSAMIRLFVQQGLDDCRGVAPGVVEGVGGLVTRDGSSTGAGASLGQPVDALREAVQRLEALCACAIVAPVLSSLDDPRPGEQAKAKLQAVLSWSLAAVPGVLKNFNASAVAQTISEADKR